MTFDSSKGQLVILGGFGLNSVEFLNDTWTWNGTNWSQANPTAAPSARAGASIAFDPGTGQLLLFGGLNTDGDLGTQ